MTSCATGPCRSQPPRSAARLLRDPVFGPFLLAKTLSTGGIWVYNIVAALVAFELSGSALTVGLVSVAQFGPQLLLAPLTGAMADRGDRRQQLVLGRLLVVIASGTLAVTVAVLGVDGLPGMWPILLTSFIVGLGFVLTGPAQNALLPALVRRNELVPAITLNAVPPILARAAGPAAGALVAVSLGPAAAFAITSATNLIFAAIMLLVLHPGTSSLRMAGDRRIRVGIQQLGRDRRLLRMIIGVAAIGVCADPVITLTPSLSADLGQGTRLVGLLASSFGVGAGAVFLVLTPLQRRVGLPRLGPMGLVMLGAGMAFAPLGASPGAAVAALGFSGAGMTLALTSLTAQLQEWLPDEVRGRVMALWSMAFLGSRPPAAALNGVMADHVSTLAAFLLVAVVGLLAAWQCRPEAVSAVAPPAGQ